MTRMLSVLNGNSSLNLRTKKPTRYREQSDKPTPAKNARDELDKDVCATISGPNGFYANHRIKASQDFAWIEEEKASSEPFVHVGKQVFSDIFTPRN
jgi:hypothetical protein